MTKMFEIAKEKDNGEFAKIGMKQYIAKQFDVDIDLPCVEEIVDTYLEFVGNISFDKYVNGLYQNGRPVILTRETLQNEYKDLLKVSDDLETIADLFIYLYDEEVYVDKTSDCIYSTNFKDCGGNRTELNFMGISMMFERLYLLYEIQILNWEDIDYIVESLFRYGYYIKADYEEYDTENVYETGGNIQKRLSKIFGL